MTSRKKEKTLISIVVLSLVDYSSLSCYLFTSLPVDPWYPLILRKEGCADYIAGSCGFPLPLLGPLSRDILWASLRVYCELWKSLRNLSPFSDQCQNKEGPILRHHLPPWELQGLLSRLA